MVVDEDEEEVFGDFKFAPSQATTIGTAFDDDDDWGDFMTNSGGLTHTSSLPATATTSKPALNPILFGSDQKWGLDWDSEPGHPGSAPGRIGDNSARWEKPKGAIPLSIFGVEEEQEEEEGSGAGGPTLADKGRSFAKKAPGGANLNDLIVDLYKQGQPGNGPGPVEEKDGKVSSLDGVEVNSNANGLFVNGSNDVGLRVRDPGLVWDPLDLNLNGVSSGGNALGSVVKDANSSANVGSSGLVDVIKGSENGDGGTEDDDDDDGWEFKVAEVRVAAGKEVSQANQVKIGNGELPNINGFNSSWDSLSSDFNGLNSKAEGVSSGASWFVTSPAADNMRNAGDLIWQFKETDSRVQVEHGNSLMKFQNGLMKTEDTSNSNLPREKLGDVLFTSEPGGLSLTFGVVASPGEQLMAESVNENKDPDDAEDWGFKSAQSELQFDDNLKSSWNMFNLGGPSHLNEVKLSKEEENLNSLGGSEDFGADDMWEFKAAESETNAGNSNSKGVEGTPGNSENIINTSGVNSASGHDDFFASSQGAYHRSGEWDFGFDFISSSVIENNRATDTVFDHKNVNGGDSLQLSPADGNIDSVESSWAFKDANLESATVDKEEPKSAKSSSTQEALLFESANQGKEAMQDNHKGALPLSIFGEEEIESNDPVIDHDISTGMPTSNPGDQFKSSNSNISIMDLISSLYSQVENNSSTNQAINPSENGSGLPNSVDTNLSNGVDNNLEDDSWEFQDASLGNRAEDQNSVLTGIQTKHFTDLELEDCIDLFIKLKEALHFAAECHLENLKKAQGAATLTVNNDETQALDKEIQDLDNELHKDGMVSAIQIPREKYFSNFVEILHDPKFHLFESEYELSKKLSTVEDDPRSIIEVLTLVASILRILKLVSREDQFSFVSTWSKMLAVCSQELRHGALIWKQLLEKNVHDKILFEPRGKEYILSLGEIYRVVEVLGSSARLYKPWIYAGSANSMDLFTLLSECVSLWSTSGLEEALQSISNSSNFESGGSQWTLLESIKYIRDLESDTLYDLVFSREEPTCHLSLLTAEAVPGMKTVLWNGWCYLLPLANLWANLIDHEPPNLPSVRVG